jgi:prepilin-type N-terminal cleavage/methylation domain-containing protein
MSRSRRAGFTLIELMITVIIIGMLSAIAVPKFREVRRRAMATQIMGDFDVMRHAALSFYVDSGYFPEPVGPGEIPPGLVRYLPTSFTFVKQSWTMNYENWTGLSPMYSSTGILVGISFSTPDTNLGRTAMTLIGNAPAFTVDDRYTFLISAF